MAFYLPAISAAIVLCALLAEFVPAAARTAKVVAVSLMGATAFAPGLAPGGRWLAVMLTAVVAVACARELRTGTLNFSLRGNS